MTDDFKEKRFLAAVMLMAGMRANKEGYDLTPEKLAGDAIADADALLEALGEVEEKEDA